MRNRTRIENIAILIVVLAPFCGAARGDEDNAKKPIPSFLSAAEVLRRKPAHDPGNLHPAMRVIQSKALPTSDRRNASRLVVLGGPSKSKTNVVIGGPSKSPKSIAAVGGTSSTLGDK